MLYGILCINGSVYNFLAAAIVNNLLPLGGKITISQLTLIYLPHHRINYNDDHMLTNGILVAVFLKKNEYNVWNQ